MEGGIDLQAVAAIVVIFVLVALLNHYNRKNQPAGTAGGESDEAPTFHPMLCTFAFHQGQEVGETVAFEGEHLILKREGTFYAVPASQAELHEGDVQLQGDLDWALAEKAGEGWLDRVSSGRDDQVSAHLTKSEDVRAPARQAFAARFEDSSETEEE